MIKKYDIIAAARAIVHKNKGYRIPVLIHPQRDWWIGIGIFALIVFIGGAVLAKMYVTNDSLDSLTGVEADRIPRYRQEVVSDALSVYRSRAAAYQAFVENRPVAPIVVEVATTTATSTEEVVEDSIEAVVTDSELIEPEAE